MFHSSGREPALPYQGNPFLARKHSLAGKHIPVRESFYLPVIIGVKRVKQYLEAEWLKIKLSFSGESLMGKKDHLGKVRVKKM